MKSILFIWLENERAEQPFFMCYDNSLEVEWTKNFHRVMSAIS
jgi:hypothetical protein